MASGMSEDHMEAIIAMNVCGFNNIRRKEWFIWAAKPQACDACGAPAYSPCMNLNTRKKNIEKPTAWPHEGRVDWARMLQGLKDRGYVFRGQG
jgi:hypothetical protein